MLMENLMSVSGTGEINIFFDETIYHVNEESLAKTALAAVQNRELTGFDLIRADKGQIKCFFNPTRMDLATAQKGSKRIIEYIAGCHTQRSISDR